MERAPRLEGSGCGVELREVATPPVAGTGSSSWCADDLVRIPGLGPRCGVEGDADGGVRAPQSKGMRTGASAHHSRRGCGRGRPRTTVAPPSDRARSVGERSPAPSLRDAPHGACRPGPARSRPAALPRRPRRDRNSLDTELSRHREVEQISRGPTESRGVQQVCGKSIGEGSRLTHGKSGSRWASPCESGIAWRAVRPRRTSDSPRMTKNNPQRSG